MIKRTISEVGSVSGPKCESMVNMRRDHQETSYPALIDCNDTVGYEFPKYQHFAKVWPRLTPDG
jgi:hypothetical protein